MMNFLVTSLLVVILHIVLTDCLSQQGCGLGASNLRQRILRGKISSPGMWPWQVGIHKQNILDGSKYNIICGGALIDPQWVVTTAHCFYAQRMSSSRIWFEADTTPLKKYKIVAGDINTQIIEPYQQERYPVEMYIHPGFRHDPYYDNDIALIKLNKPVATSHLVGTVCLPDANIDLAKPGTVGTATGWGRTSTVLVSTLLLHTTILIRTNTVCKQATTYYVNKTVTFCAGDDHGGNDTCTGDSGGSLVRRVTVKGQRRWVTVGLVSWGEGCGLPGKYGYYTRMHPFLTWIKDTVNASMFSCSHPGDIPFGKLISAYRMTRFPIGFRVKYRCSPGYILKGKSGQKCRGGGKWTRPPVCVKDCADKYYWCSSHKSYCNTSKYTYDLCPYTCGTCKDGATTKPKEVTLPPKPTRPPPTPTTARPTTQTDCVDKYYWCSIYKSFCNTSKLTYASCPFTCGNCKGK